LQPEGTVQTIGLAQIAADHEVWPDTDLVTAVRAGEDSAFEELYRRYYDRVARYVGGFVRDRGRAEDVTQEAFVSALRRLRETDSEIAFRPWIHEIARNASIDLYRRSSRTREVSIDSDAGLPPADAARLHGGVPPEVAIISKERLQHLRGALDELSDTHHRAIVLRELEGLSYAEIGDRMELSLSAVESTLFRARRRLEREYAELDTGRRCRLVTASIARMAEGMYSERERRRVDRHCHRCSTCRVRARKLGVEPVSRPRIAARAAALLPLPAFLRRRLDPHGSDAAAAGQGGSSLLAAQPALEAATSKAMAVIAAVALVGGGGATLGGEGPLAAPGADPAPRHQAGPLQRTVPDITRRLAPARSPEAGRPWRDSRMLTAPEHTGREARKGAASLDVRRDGAHKPAPAAPPATPPSSQPPPASPVPAPAAPGPSGVSGPETGAVIQGPASTSPSFELAAPPATPEVGATAPGIGALDAPPSVPLS